MEHAKICRVTLVLSGLVIFGANAVHAQTSSGSQSTITDFARTYNIKVVQSNTPIAAAPTDSAPPTDRLRDLQKLADDRGATWQKIYRVTPASSAEPVTTLSSAQQMVDQQGVISMSLGSVPAISAMKTIAQADNATVQFIGGGTMGAIHLDLNNVLVPQAITAIAKRTHTNWQAEYVIAPVEGGQVSLANVAVGPKTSLTAQQNEAANMFNGPITIHVSSSNVNHPASEVGSSSNSQAQSGAIAAVPPVRFPQSNPYNDSNYPYNVDSGTYNNGFTSVTTTGVNLPTGIVEQNPGYYNPYLGNSLILNSGTVTSF